MCTFLKRNQRFKYSAMKLILILVMVYLSLIQMIDSKMYRTIFEDKVLPYMDKSIPHLSDHFLLDNFILEQIDDDNVEIGGYGIALKSMDRNLPLVMNMRTQVYENARWNEAAYRVTWPSMCPEFINPLRFWYNVTKLWTSDLCPPLKGDRIDIETHMLNMQYDMPSTMPIGPWRVYILVTQGIPGFEKVKFGYGIQAEFVPV